MIGLRRDGVSASGRRCAVTRRRRRLPLHLLRRLPCLQRTPQLEDLDLAWLVASDFDASQCSLAPHSLTKGFGAPELDDPPATGLGDRRGGVQDLAVPGAHAEPASVVDEG